MKYKVEGWMWHSLSIVMYASMHSEKKLEKVATLGGGAETQTLKSYRPQPPQHSLHTEATYPPFSQSESIS